MRWRTTAAVIGFVLILGAAVLPAPQTTLQVSPSLYADMRWRAIGPHRGGRTRSAAGHPNQPYTFYIGVCNGGVWKTIDAGRTWKPIFDDQPTGSIGSVVIAPSDPNTIYVGSGEGLHRPDLSTGDGVYKSTDGGRTWTHVGLRDGQQIPNIAVDPRNADRLFVAVLGHPYGPNEERGIFRWSESTRKFERVLYKDENTGGNDVDIDPSNPRVVYATLWEARQGPWENAAWSGTSGGIFKSVDGGTTWKQLTQGLPQTGVIQANLSISPSNPKRLYASVASPGSVGIYRSDDAGETWVQTTTDGRPAGRIGGGDLPVPIAHPQNADILIMGSTVSWKSVDAGKSWVPFKGAPGGEDYQGGWINPENPDIMLLVADQGAVVTLNGGSTWSSWYNQPTAQLYHVAADHAFPYRVCSGQQESGSACVASRGNYGAISLRDWLPVGVDEYGYVAPDPLNPDLVYGGRSVTRFDRRTGQVSAVGPVGRGGAPATTGQAFRQVRTMPVVFSEVDKRALFFANNVLWKTIDGGLHWAQISSDLTRKTWTPPKSIGKYLDQPTAQPSQRGVIYTVAPSYKDINRIWVGTDDGLIHTTSDGGVHWSDVTPPEIGPWAKVSIIDAGRFDALTAYAAINTIRLDDMRPHIFRTHDGGKTWREIVFGLPLGDTVNAVREDPKKKGLLFAGTERAVFVSFDDGEHWQPLRLNMAASSVRDLIVKDDDLVAATHGRGFWILDDITPLRQIDARSADSEAILFKPTIAWRVRWNTSTDMPWPVEEPTGANPPEGAIINYYLKSEATGPVTLEILEANGRVARRYASTDSPPQAPEPANAPVPTYWYRPRQLLSTAPGMHRFMWDVHYQPLATGGGGRGGLPIAAIPYNTAAGPGTPWVAPGQYTVKLTVNGKSYTQPITVKQDPRVQTPPLVMQQVYTLTKAVYDAAADVQAAFRDLQAIRDQAAKIEAQAQGQGAVVQALADFGKKATALQGAPPPGTAGRGAGGPGPGAGQGGRGGPAEPPALPDTLTAVGASLGGVINLLQSADVEPTSVQLTAIVSARQAAAKVMARWNVFKSVEVAELNAKLKSAGLAVIPLPTGRVSSSDR